MPRPKILVVTRHSPLPDNDGAGAYLFDLLSYLRAQGARIEVVWVAAEGRFVRAGSWRVPRSISRVCDVRVIGSLPVGPFRYFWWGALQARVLGVVKAILMQLGLWRGATLAPMGIVAGRLPIKPLPARKAPAPAPEWSSLPTPEETRFFAHRLSRFQPDIVLANYCWMAPLLQRQPIGRRLVLTHDVASHRLNLSSCLPRGTEVELSPANPEGEKRLLDHADVVLAISADDAATFRAMLPDKQVLVAPKSAAVRNPKGEAIAGRCLFVGGVNGPNREGLQWFLERVWPEIRTAHPTATLHVCGGICDVVRTTLPAGVVLRGRVPDLGGEYAAAEVVVVPLLQGTGVKIKLVEACGFGRPCVTTPVGLQGLPFLADAVLEATSPVEFVESVLRVLKDQALRQELSRRAHQKVAENLSPQRCYGEVWSAIARTSGS